MELTQVHTFNFTGVLSASKKIILSRSTHFLTLSLLFLPLSLSLITTRLRLPDHPFTGDPSNHQTLLLSYLIYTLTVHILTLCAIGTVTYTTHHAFFGEPVTISDALKSLIFSFFPLASTAIISYVLIFFISLSFLLFVGSILMLAQNLGFSIDYNSIHFMWFSAIVGAILIAIVIYLHVEWSLAFPVVVVESKWGFAPLIRSSYLVKGMRSVSLLVMLYIGIGIVFIVWISSADLHFMLTTMLGLIFTMMLSVRMTAANTVLYNYCKALHGELAIEIADGFVHDYINLPADDQKVPHVGAA